MTRQRKIFVTVRACAALFVLASTLLARPLPARAIERVDFGPRSVAGVIVGYDSGQPVSDLAVAIRNARGHDIGLTTTDSHGAFAFLELAPGQYKVYSPIGFFDEITVAVTEFGQAPYIDTTVARPIPPARAHRPDLLGSRKIFYGTDRSDLSPGASRVVEQPAAEIHIGEAKLDPDDPKQFSENELLRGSRVDIVPPGFPNFRQRRVIVFVPGFSVSFASALADAARISRQLPADYDVVLFSWASRDSLLPSDYVSDEGHTLASGRDLAKFISWIAASRPSKVMVFAHSMGCQVTLNAFASGVDLHQTPSDVVFAAPDVSLESLTAARTKFAMSRTHLTLYTSQRDQALLVSRRLREVARIFVPLIGMDPIRAGELLGPIGPGGTLDVVDASRLPAMVFGHKYYLSDLFLKNLVDDFDAVRVHPYTPREIEIGSHGNLWQLVPPGGDAELFSSTTLQHPSR